MRHCQFRLERFSRLDFLRYQRSGQGVGRLEQRDVQRDLAAVFHFNASIILSRGRSRKAKGDRRSQSGDTEFQFV
jgi:hypothetical protein